MKKVYTILFLSLSLLTLSACNNKEDAADTKPKETTISKKSKEKAEKKKESTAKTSETSVASSAQIVQTPEEAPVEQPSQNNQQARVPEDNTIAPSQPNQTQQIPNAEQPSQNPEEAQAHSNIYNRLVAARDAAINHQNEWVAEGGSPNDVQSAVSAVIIESTSLKTEYPQYSDYIENIVRQLGY